MTSTYGNVLLCPGEFSGEFPVIAKRVHVEFGNVLRSVPFSMLEKEVS